MKTYIIMSDGGIIGVEHARKEAGACMIFNNAEFMEVWEDGGFIQRIENTKYDPDA